jgi:hypothetical protein
MPHARIDLHRVHKDRLPEISNAILAGMVRGLEMPEDDLFQIFRLHDPGELVFSPTFPDADRDDIIFIELLAGRVYTAEVKHAGMVAIGDELEALGIKRDSLLMHVVEVEPTDWYSPGSASA